MIFEVYKFIHRQQVFIFLRRYRYVSAQEGEISEKEKERRRKISEGRKKFFLQNPKAKKEISERMKGDKNPTKRLEVKRKLSNSEKKYFKENPEALKRTIEFLKSPEMVKKRKEALQKPEVKKKRNESLKKYYQENPNILKKVIERLKSLEVTEKRKKALKKPEVNIKRSKKMKEVRLNIIIPKKDTSIEIKLQDELKKKAIEFRTHEPILGQPDIFIPPNVCIFADGDYWHKYPNGTERDKEVTEGLEKQGFIVIRLWEHEINEDIEGCIQKIIAVSGTTLPQSV